MGLILHPDIWSPKGHGCIMPCIEVKVRLSLRFAFTVTQPDRSLSCDASSLTDPRAATCRLTLCLLERSTFEDRSSLRVSSFPVLASIATPFD